MPATTTISTLVKGNTTMHLVVQVLESLGFFDIILPFLLIFSIVYGILFAGKIFGEGPQSQAIMAFTAFIVAFFVMYAAAMTTLGIILTDILTKASIFLIIFLIGVLLAGMLGAKWGMRK